MVICINGCLHPSFVHYIGFGGKVVNVGAFGAKMELNGVLGMKVKNEELMQEAKY